LRPRASRRRGCPHDREPALGGSALASVGAIAAGFALFWTIAAISISISIAIAILSVLVARRGSARPSVQPA